MSSIQRLWCEFLGGSQQIPDKFDGHSVFPDVWGQIAIDLEDGILKLPRMAVQPVAQI